MDITPIKAQAREAIFSAIGLLLDHVRGDLSPEALTVTKEAMDAIYRHAVQMLQVDPPRMVVDQLEAEWDMWLNVEDFRFTGTDREVINEAGRFWFAEVVPAMRAGLHVDPYVTVLQILEPFYDYANHLDVYLHDDLWERLKTISDDMEELVWRGILTGEKVSGMVQKVMHEFFPDDDDWRELLDADQWEKELNQL